MSHCLTQICTCSKGRELRLAKNIFSHTKTINYSIFAKHSTNHPSNTYKCQSMSLRITQRARQ